MQANRCRAVRLSVCVLVICAAVTGCQSHDSSVTWDDPAVAQRLAMVRDHGLPVEYRRAVTSVALRDGQMQTLVDLALANNPEVAASRRRIDRMREHPAIASALDDPALSLTAGELAQTAAGQVDYILELTQTLPYPGTRKTRAALAEHHVLSAATQMLEQVEQVAAEVRRVYWRRYAVVRAIEVTEQDQAILSQISGIIDARARVGQAQQADQLRIALRSADLDQQIDRLNQQLRSLDAIMNRLLNRSATDSIPRPQREEWAATPYDHAAMVMQAQLQNPAVHVQRRVVESYRHQFKLAQIERRPDFRIGVQYGAVGGGLAASSNGDDQFALTTGITLPFFSDKYDAMEREAFRGIGEALAGLDAAQGRAANQAEDALARMEAEESILTRLSAQMLPDSRRAFELAMTGYRAGTVSFIQMMDDWQRTLDLELAAHRAHARYEQAHADLAAAMGEVSAQIAESVVPPGGHDHE